ncbi:MAG: hypothetical protein LLF95_02745 [Bacteroidales bacterium]|nr:hypothetical protein [Bacteroidales bacterium]
MKKIFVFLCLFLSLPLPLPLPLLVSAQDNAILNALNQYDYQLAIQLMNKEKKSPELEILKAKCYKNLLKYGAATAILENVVRNDSLNIQALSELADCYQSAGNFKSAELIYSNCLRLEPDNQYFHLNYINILYKLKDWDKTAVEIHQAFRRDTIPVLYSLLGDCYWQLDKNDSTIFYYKKCLTYSPEDYNTVFKLSKIYLQTQRYNEMIGCTNDYISIDSTNKTINQYNGIGYCFTQQFDKAILRLEKLYSEGDKSYTTNYFLGSSYFGLKDYYPAYEHLSEAYANDSSNLNLIYYLGRSAILNGKHAAGIAVLNRGLELAIPKDSVLYNFYSHLALGYSRWNKPQEAIKNYEICMKLKPESQITIYTIAGIYDYNLKNAKQALKYYNMFLASFPKEPEKNKEEFLNELSGTYYSAVKHRIEELKTELFFRKE